MKIAAEKVVPVFAPVTITLECEGELRFLFEALGCTTNNTDREYGMEPETSWNAYESIQQIAAERGIDLEKGRKYDFKMTKRSEV